MSAFENPYPAIRSRLVALASDLDEVVAGSIVPGTPDWTVTDVYAHLSGACDDILSGRLEGITSDEWTGAQVEKRQGWSLSEVLSEWVAFAPRFDTLIDELGPATDPRLFIDAWTHEQDVRGLLGIPGGLDITWMNTSARASAESFSRRAARAALAPLGVRWDGFETEAFSDAAVVLNTTPFEFMRALVGRRSRGQLREMGWVGAEDPDPYIDTLMVFGMARTDIVDALD